MPEAEGILDGGVETAGTPKGFRWKYRYTVLAILFATSVVSFMDRMAMSVAIPYIAKDFHLAPSAMGLVLGIFFAGYALFQIPGGLLADKFGFRRVATIALLWWSGFTAITGAATTLTQMLIARLCFGLGEAVLPTCAFKTVAVWFPKRERGTANAIMLTAGPLGSALAPLVVVQVVLLFGWRAVFYSLFVPGLIVAALFWAFIADKPSQKAGVSASELEELAVSEAVPISSAESRIGLGAIIMQPGILQLCAIYFFFDIAFWGFTNWLPTYLVTVRGLSVLHMGIAASLPQISGMIGNFFGGWTSDKYFASNRRVPILASQALSAAFLYLTFVTASAELMIVFETIAGFFLNAFFAAFWAVPMTTVSPRLMGVTTGTINTAGQTAAFISPLLIGVLVGASGGAFGWTFALLIGAAVASFIVTLTISKSRREG